MRLPFQGLSNKGYLSSRFEARFSVSLAVSLTPPHFFVSLSVSLPSPPFLSPLSLLLFLHSTPGK